MSQSMKKAINHFRCFIFVSLYTVSLSEYAVFTSYDGKERISFLKAILVELSRFNPYLNLTLENKGQGLLVRKYASKYRKRN